MLLELKLRRYRAAASAWSIFFKIKDVNDISENYVNDFSVADDGHQKTTVLLCFQISVWDMTRCVRSLAASSMDPGW